MPNPVLNLEPKQKVTLCVAGLITGKFGRFVGTPTWSSSDTTKIAVKPAKDGITCDCISLGPTGTATVTVNAVGTGALSGSVDLTVATILATSLAVGAKGPSTTYP